MARERRSIPLAFADRLTARQREAAALAYARWSPADIADELSICTDSAGELLTSVYAKAGITGGRGKSKQRPFIKYLDRLAASSPVIITPAEPEEAPFEMGKREAV
jgi:DNA-binding CsgD family transcriptional regulator